MRANRIASQPSDRRRHRALALGLLAGLSPGGAAARQGTPAPPLTVTRPAPPPAIPPLIPPPVAVTPGYPLTTFDASILDGATRFLTSGPAQARCPGQEVVFVFGVTDPLRPTAAGDGAFMCRGDAIAQGYLSR